MSPWAALLVGLVAGALVGWAGYALAALSASAAMVLALVSGACGALGGWAWAAVLCLVVLSNSLWQRYYDAQAPARPVRRLSWVALAAGLAWPLALSALSALSGQPERVAAAFVGASATLAADRWATLLGMLSKQPPRSLITRRRVAAGTPGAASLLGSVAALNAAWLVGLVAMFLLAAQAALEDNGAWSRGLRWLPLCGALGGLAGSLVDSFLGATAQALYYCEACDAYSETPVHECGRRAAPVRGWPWLTNDGVNLASTVVGAGVAATLYLGLARSSMPW
jgi:uncharacterized membrane protein